MADLIFLITNLPWWVFAVAGAIVMGLVTVLEKQELRHEHSLEYVVILSCFTMVMAGFLWPWVDFGISAVTLAWIYIASVLGALSLWGTAKSLRHLDVSVVAPQLNLSLVFALVFAMIFLGEGMSGVQLAGAALILLGSLVLTRHTLHSHGFAPHALLVSKVSAVDEHSPKFYQGLVIVSMVLLGLGVIVDKVALGQTTAVTFIFFVHVFLAINHLILYGIVHGSFRDLPKGLTGASWKTFWVAFLAVASRLSMAQALGLAGVSLVTPVKRLASVFSTLVGGRLMGEDGLWLRVIVSAVMIVGVWLVAQ